MRLFAALVPPARVREDLAREAAQRLNADFRATPAERIHLTLLFLGERAESWVAPFRQALEDRLAARGPVDVSPGGPGAFPGGTRARVLWVGLEPEAELLALHEDCRAAAASAGGAESSAGERFRPHLTLARARGRGAAEVPESWAGLPPVTGWRADALSLFRSVSGPSGPRYEELFRLRFPGGAAGVAGSLSIE